MDRIGKYTIIEEIGRGGMGVVYRAHDKVIDRDVAIKVILERALELPDIRERFYREARSAGRLSHENIVVIHDVAEADGLPYIVMEYLPGIDLRHAMEDQAELTLERKFDIAIQICRGLHYAHQNQVIHRDIKPENIRILKPSRVKIVDFGIARLGSDSLTLTQGSIGTPRYMSPEQIRGDKIDHRADIFSLGVLLYELISGQNPFGGENITTVIYRILHEKPGPIEHHNEAFSSELERVLGRCLEKDPNERYQDCQSIADDLDKIRSTWKGAVTEPQETVVRAVTNRRFTGNTSAIPTQTPVKLDKPVTPAPTRRNRRMVVSGGIVLLVLALISFAMMSLVKEPVDEAAKTSLALQTQLSEAEQTEIAEAEDLNPLIESAEKERQLMHAQRVRADELNARTKAVDSYRKGMQEEKVAEQAFNEANADGYRRAQTAFSAAKEHYSDAAIKAIGNSSRALNEQVRQVQMSMESIREEVLPRRTESVIAEVFEQADRLRSTGRQQVNNERFAEAIRSFVAAEEGYREARDLLRNLSAAQKSDADRVRNELENLLRSATEKEYPAKIPELFTQAQSIHTQAVQAYERQDYQSAAEDFKNAHALLEAGIRTQLEADRVSLELRENADQTRRASLTEKEKIPARYRNTPIYEEALAMEARAQQAYQNADYSEASRLYSNTKDLFSRAFSPSMVVPSETRNVLAELSQAITSNNWEGVPPVVTAYYREKISTIRRSMVISRVTTLSDQLILDQGSSSARMLVTVNVHYHQKGSDLERGFPIESRWLWERVDEEPVLIGIE